MNYVIRPILSVAALLIGGATLPAAELPTAFIALDEATNVTGISGDGSVAVGGNAIENFYWTERKGTVYIGGIGVAQGGLPRVSADGRTIVGGAEFPNGNNSAALWLGGSDWQTLGGLSPAGCPDHSSVYGVSGDGSALVGLGWDGCRARGFRWEESTGMVDLGTLVEGRNSRANHVSDDGHVIVGWNDTLSGRWVAAKWVDGVEEYILDQGIHLGEALATNHDGSIIVGDECSDPDDAWIWTETTGVTCVGLPGADNVIFDTSDDGRVMGGWWTTSPMHRQGVVYFDRQPVFLADHLLAAGITDAQGWISLGGVLAVSSNGRMIGGWGINGSGIQQGYLVKFGLDAPELTLDSTGTTAELMWDAVPVAEGYDVVRGSLGDLIGTDGDFVAATDLCMASDTLSMSIDDFDVPAPGNAYWYAIRPRTRTDGDSYDSLAYSQTGSRDGGINASVSGCPD
jgi:uncharacterized membrane protein